MAQKGLSLRPDTFSKGGMPSLIKGRITEAKFLSFDFNGKSDPKPCLMLGIEDVHDPELTYEQHYTAGNPANFEPSEDGNFLCPTHEDVALSNRSNLGALLNAFVAAGFPEDKLEGGDAREFKDMVVLFTKRLPEGREAQGDNPDAGKLYLPETIIAMPGESMPDSGDGKKAKAAGGKKKAKAAPSKKAEDNGDSGDDPEAVAQAAVLEILGAAEGTLPKKELFAPITKHEAIKGLAKDVKASVLKLAVSDEWLGHADRPWTYEDGVLSL